MFPHSRHSVLLPCHRVKHIHGHGFIAKSLISFRLTSPLTLSLHLLPTAGKTRRLKDAACCKDLNDLIREGLLAENPSPKTWKYSPLERSGSDFFTLASRIGGMAVRDTIVEEDGENCQDMSQLKLVPVQNGLLETEKMENTAKKLFVGAGARILFYPTLLYNVLRNKLQAEFRWWDQIDQFLLLGAVPFPKDVLRLKDLGVEAVVTLNEPYETLVPTSMYQSQGIKQLVIPTQDYLFAPSLGNIERGVEFIHENIQQGKKTYVHCKAGRGRSTTVVLCYLVEHKSMTPCDAFRYIQSKRPRVLLAASQWQAVLEYSDWKNQHHKISLPVCSNRLLLPHYPISKHRSKSEQCVKIVNQEESNCSFDDTPVLVTSSDLDGYRGVQDAGVIGNEFPKELRVAYKIRFMAVRSVVGVAKASAALAKLSGLWIGCQATDAAIASTLKCSVSLNANMHNSAALDSANSNQMSAIKLALPVCKQGMVEC